MIIDDNRSVLARETNIQFDDNFIGGLEFVSGLRNGRVVRCRRRRFERRSVVDRQPEQTSWDYTALLNPQTAWRPRLKTQSSDASNDGFTKPDFDQRGSFVEQRPIQTSYPSPASCSNVRRSPVDSAAVIGFNTADRAETTSDRGHSRSFSAFDRPQRWSHCATSPSTGRGGVRTWRSRISSPAV